MDRELDIFMASLPPDAAEPGDGMRYLLEHAPFLIEMPQRINFRVAVRRMLREGRVGEALLAAIAYDARTVELRSALPDATETPRAPDVHDAGSRGSTEDTGGAGNLDPTLATWRIEEAQPGPSG